jgi:hypothetical protein
MSVTIHPAAVSLVGKNVVLNLDDWLTVHHSITLVDFQLDAQNSCLFTYNTYLTIPEAAYKQLRRRPPEGEQGNARNM